MASYTVDADEVGVQNKTLAISTVDTVTFGADIDGVVVFSDGTAALYFTVDGTTPTIGGAKTHSSPAGVRSARRVTVPTSGNTVVKLISSGAVGYSVEASRDEAPILGAAVELGQTSLDALENVTATVEAGAAGNSAPSLATNASGIIGWLRKLVDVLSGTLTISGAVTGPLTRTQLDASPVLVGSTTAVASNDGSSVATGTSSATLVAANADRKFLQLINTGATDVWISLGGTAVVGEGIPLYAGGGWEMPTDARYTGAIKAIGTSASTVAVTEY